MAQEVRVRFAPSPTGYFHLGGARTALYNWLFARHNGGKFILRIEDTDRTRYHPDAVPFLLESLRWLGCMWDEGPEVGGSCGPYYQSDRIALYQQYAEQLIAEGKAYRCYCSSERLAALREQQHAQGVKPGYDRHCRHLTRQQIADYEAAGVAPVVRLAIPLEGETAFEDRLRGRIVVNNSELDDLVLLKSDGFPTYHLGVVVDDHLMGVTHILRGDEWLASAPKHQLLYDAFGWQMPEHVHLPTILDPSGKGKLSKRRQRGPGQEDQLTFIHEFRQAGYLPEAMVNFLALVGWSYDSETEFFTRDKLIRYFDLDRVSKSPSAFSYDKLQHMNAVYIRNLGDNDLTNRLLPILRAAGFKADFGRVLAFAPLIKERLRLLGDAVDMLRFALVDSLEYPTEDLVPRKLDAATAREILARTRTVLAALPSFQHAVTEAALRELADGMGLKLRDALGSTRVAITGAAVSPPLFESMEILGRECVLARLDEAIARLG
ncbi:MAG: glutamate--tRNA ligase [Anaerolineae bacterium]|jgi:glutamyl-tRNA synthetase|nr:glutamate--tRNA ligase [Chloroflexota bacterium]